MGTTYSFKKKTKERVLTIKDIQLRTAALKFANTEAGLPPQEEENTLIFTRDTSRFFLGQGEGKSLIEFDADGLLFFDSKNDFPVEGKQNKLYISLEDGSFHAWFTDAYVQLSVGRSVTFGQLAEKPTYYPHAPHTHIAEEVLQDTEHQMVTDVQVSQWTDKLIDINGDGKFVVKTTGDVSAEDFIVIETGQGTPDYKITLVPAHSAIKVKAFRCFVSGADIAATPGLAIDWNANATNDFMLADYPLIIAYKMSATKTQLTGSAITYDVNPHTAKIAGVEKDIDTIVTMMWSGCAPCHLPQIAE